MYSNLSSSPMYTATRPSCATNGLAPSCAKRPSAVRLTGARVGSRGSISTIQPKRNGSVGVLRQVEARIDGFPARTANAPSTCASAGATRRCTDRRRCAPCSSVEVAEIVLDVFFGRQVRAPRRLAAGAVAERAERPHAVGIGLRAHQRSAARRAADVDRRFGSDAPIETRVLHHPPAPAARARSR